jgi:glycosyltransferase involved in cell wall biosynthesis
VEELENHRSLSSWTRSPAAAPGLEAPPRLSVAVPCFNEEEGIAATVGAVVEALAARGDAGGFEVVIVDDGSTDGSAGRITHLTERLPGVRAVRHDENQGYGAALKTALRASRGELVAITDADGSYPAARIGELLDLAGDAEMVVGARAAGDRHSSKLRRLPKAFLRRWVSWLAGRRVPDINSGFRVFRRDVAMRFLGLLPDGFSFTTTLTLAVLRSGYRVRWLPIETAPRRGRSKIRPVRDTLAFLHLILRTGTYFAPLRMLAPVVALLAAAFAVSAGYDVLVLRNLTDKTLILFLFTFNTFLFALLADMIDKRSR